MCDIMPLTCRLNRVVHQQQPAASCGAQFVPAQFKMLMTSRGSQHSRRRTWGRRPGHCRRSSRPGARGPAEGAPHRTPAPLLAHVQMRRPTVKAGVLVTHNGKHRSSDCISWTHGRLARGHYTHKPVCDAPRLLAADRLSPLLRAAPAAATGASQRQSRRPGRGPGGRGPPSAARPAGAPRAHGATGEAARLQAPPRKPLSGAHILITSAFASQTPGRSPSPFPARGSPPRTPPPPSPATRPRWARCHGRRRSAAGARAPLRARSGTPSPRRCRPARAPRDQPQTRRRRRGHQRI